MAVIKVINLTGLQDIKKKKTGIGYRLINMAEYRKPRCITATASSQGDTAACRRIAARRRPAHDVRLLHVSVPNMVGDVKLNECIEWGERLLHWS